MAYIVKEHIQDLENKGVVAKSWISNKNINVEYYKIVKGTKMHVGLGEDEESTILIYIVLSGKLSFEFLTEKVLLEKGKSIEIFDYDTREFEMFAQEDTAYLFINSCSKSTCDTDTDKLFEKLKQLEVKDVYTYNHNQRVCNYSILIMGKIDSNYHKTDLMYASQYHDIGKINIDEKILNKTERLTNEEFALIKKHPVYSYELLKPILGERIANLARWHHEKLDGSGYPDGLKARDIPLESRIITVSDIFDALTTSRSYRHRPYTFDEALEIMQKDVNDYKLDEKCFNALKELVLSKRIVPTNDNCEHIYE